MPVRPSAIWEMFLLLWGIANIPFVFLCLCSFRAPFDWRKVAVLWLGVNVGVLGVGTLLQKTWLLYGVTLAALLFRTVWIRVGTNAKT